MREEVIGLFNAYDFTLREDLRLSQMRFQGYGTFLDLWYGKKGMTLGVYNPDSQKMWFKRQCSLESIEDVLLEIKNKKV